MQGFRKVDPDRWEFANEGFLGGQKHLLKTIRRRRNAVPQTVNQQQGGGSCVELGQFGMEEELEMLKRDRNLLMAEIIKLKQQQQNSRERVLAMEKRIKSTEKKQRQIMGFLAKVFRSPSFLKQCVDKYGQNDKHVEIGQKRRLAMSPSAESLVDAATIATGITHSPNYASQGQEGLAADVPLDVETLLSTAYVPPSSSEVKGLSAEAVASGSNTDTGLNPMMESIWEKFFSDDLATGDEAAEALAADQTDVEVEELVASSPVLDEDLQDLVDHLGFL